MIDSLITLLLLMTFSTCVSAQFTTSPQNTLTQVNAGVMVQLNCSSTAASSRAAYNWTFTPADGSQTQTVVSGCSAVRPYYNTSDVTQNDCNLYVSVINASLAGLYSCRTADGNSASARLIVIDCSSSYLSTVGITDGSSSVSATSSCNYVGNDGLQPLIIWKATNQMNLNATRGFSNSTYTLSTLDVDTTNVNPFDEFTASATIRADNGTAPAPGVAQNIPYYVLVNVPVPEGTASGKTSKNVSSSTVPAGTYISVTALCQTSGPKVLNPMLSWSSTPSYAFSQYAAMNQSNFSNVTAASSTVVLLVDAQWPSNFTLYSNCTYTRRLTEQTNTTSSFSLSPVDMPQLGNGAGPTGRRPEAIIAMLIANWLVWYFIGHRK